MMCVTLFDILCVAACAVFSFEGSVAALLLFICACAYFQAAALYVPVSKALDPHSCLWGGQRVPLLKDKFFSERKGAWGTLYKGAPSTCVTRPWSCSEPRCSLSAAAVIGKRLHWQVSAACAFMGVYILIFK